MTRAFALRRLLVQQRSSCESALIGLQLAGDSARRGYIHVVSVVNTHASGVVAKRSVR